jgi:hypothetical protein
MGKSTYAGFVPKDDPMFSGGFEMFSRPGSTLSSTSSDKSTDGPKLPEAPKREDFSSAESYEEALSYWRTSIGRIKGLASLASRKK